MQWTEIPPSYRDAMERRLLVHLRSLRGRELSDLLSGSIGMNYLWHKNPAIRDAVYLQIIHIYGQQQQQPINVHDNQNNDAHHEGEEEGDIGVKREGIEEEGEEEEDGENHNHVMITIQEENEIDLADAYENYEEN